MIATPLLPAVQDLVRAARGLSDATLDRDFAWRGQDADVRWSLFGVYTDLCDLAAALATQRSEHGPGVTVAQRAMAQAHAAYRDLQGLLLAAEAIDIDQPPAQGEWPLRDVLGHMLRTEAGFIAVLQWAIDRVHADDGRPAQMPDDKLRQGRPPHDQSGDLAAILGRFDARQAEIVDRFAGLQADDLAAPFVWWFTADVRFQLFRFDAHLREHTIQVAKLLEALAPPPSDALRTLRLIYGALGDAEGWLIGAPALAPDLVATTADRIRVATDALGALQR